MKTEIYLQKVEKIFIECGFKEISMDRLAAKSGITKRTLYNNFESRDDIFRCLTDMQREKIRSKTLPLFSEYGIDATAILNKWFICNIQFIESLGHTYISTLRTYRTQWFAEFDNMILQNCREFTALLIPRGRDEGLFIKDFDTDSYARFIHRILSTSSQESVADDIGFLTRAICTRQLARK